MKNRFVFFNQCVIKTVLNLEDNLLEDLSKFDNCRMLIKSNQKYGCFSCNHGYTGTVV